MTAESGRAAEPGRSEIGRKQVVISHPPEVSLGPLIDRDEDETALARPPWSV
jgi:hypothetical protein